MRKIIASIRTLGIVAVAVAAALSSDAPALAAGSATSNMTVSAEVSANCSISAGALAFGTYDPVVANASSGGDLAGTATLSVACTSGASATITLGQGSNAAGGSTDAAPLRQMASGTDNLAYALYQDSGHTTAWGNSAGTGEEYTGTGSSTNVTVYGLVAKGQNVPAGSYSDTVVATITF
jgi:spore coat protein U-like protein